MDLNEQLKNCHIVGIVRPKTQFTSSSGHTSIKPRQPFNSRIVQNFILVWLDPCINEMNDNDRRHSIIELQRVVNSINVYTDADECIDFLTDIKDEKIFLIISDELGQNIVPLVHNVIQINSIYVFCKNKSQYKEWAQQWPKVKNIFTAVSPMCQAVKQDAQKCDQDSIPISFVSASSGKLNQNLDQLDPTFMYTQILKEILLTINFDKQHIKDFSTYYRKNFADNPVQLNNIDDFERNYDNHGPIWWYTHDSCFYSVLNRALRMMEVDTIIKLGFFIGDLHRQIVQLHSEQLSEHNELERFTIYRGQGLSKTDFAKMQDTQGGLISFNNFLSTSKDLDVAVSFARSSLAHSASVGIVFVMTIDPSIKSTPFGSINDVSYYRAEEEILFSMHTVFRIGDMIQSNDDHRLWQVNLIQTNDNDSELNDLTKRIRDETQGLTEWDRLGKLLIKLGRFDKAEELYKVLIDQTDSDGKKTHFYHQLGWSEKNQKKYEEARTSYEKSLEIKHKIRRSTHFSFSMSYNDIGSIYEKMNKYSNALLYYEKGLEIQQLTSSSDRSGLASSYSNIASVYEKMGEYSKAFSFYEKAVEIQQEIPPSNNRILAKFHNKIGYLYEKMGEYPKAILSHKKAIEIQQKILPSNHPELAQSHSGIGFVYGKMHQYSKAREFHKHAVDMGERSLPANHPRLQTWRKNLEYAKRKRN